MSRLSATIPTTLALLLHGLFGCCWHHDHIHAGAVDDGAAAACLRLAEFGGNGHDESGGEDPEHQDAPGCGWHCVYLVSSARLDAPRLEGVVLCLQHRLDPPGRVVGSRVSLSDPCRGSDQRHDRAQLQRWLI